MVIDVVVVAVLVVLLVVVVCCDGWLEMIGCYDKGVRERRELGRWQLQ